MGASQNEQRSGEAPAMKLNDEQRRALVMIAEAEPRGCTDAVLMMYFKLQTIVDLITAGLANVRTEVVRAGGRTIKTPRVGITDAGRRRLAH
jgi:hypothetical protein